jgi:ABC-type glycerol-3-phosphate transport system substrate-binding protein
MKINLQLIILIFFIVATVFGVLVFSGAIPIGQSTKSGTLGTITLWGTFPADEMATPLQAFNAANTTFVVKYVQKSADTFNQDLLEALASGTGPDLFFLPDNLAYHYANKIFTIPYASYPSATFQNTFADAGKVFLTDNGILAFPMSIDPLMMYYNRSMLDANDIVYPPATWDDLSNMVSTLTVKDNANNISKSAVAFGQFSNVTNAKDILATLFMQTGNPIVTDTGGVSSSTLTSPQTGTNSVSSMLNFYTNFSNPNNALYSWNASFPDSSDDFSNENLAFYFGFASELQSLKNKNPNQDFFVAPVPQIKNSNTKVTDAQVTGLAILSSSKNFSTAFTAASLLATGDFASAFATATGTVPARRDLLAVKPTDVYSPYFYSSALFARSWLDPSSTDTDNIFSGMINNVLSGNMSAPDAIRDANAKIDLLLSQ